MAALVFGDAWAREWCAQIRSSESYRRAAAGWRGTLVLVAAAAGAEAERSVFADLREETCREARSATPPDLAGADYVIRGTPAIWRAVLDRRSEPIAALMRGQLALVRGNLVTLVRYVAAAQELVAAATRVATEFPPSWRATP